MTARPAFSNLTASYYTFGCKLNFAETATIAASLEEKGVVTAVEGTDPDIIVVNTCSVTSVADRKCRQTIRTLHRRHPEASIIVTGCYAQLKPGEVSGLPGVVMVIGNDRKNDLPKLLEQCVADRRQAVEVVKATEFTTFRHSCSRGNRTRYFLKVQDGCNYFCSYCAIPYARGRSRSPLIAELVDKARGVVEQGGKEIVLTGVNIGHFGWGTDENFLGLIKALDTVDGIERYRISSIEPELLSPEIIEFVASSNKFMPHFHIPLQNGSDEVLKLMRRHYDTGLFAERIENVRRLVPDAFIGIDLIVGMRGETDQLFEESVRFIESLPVSRLHVFPYSEREGTAALRILHVVEPEEKKRRLQTMLSISDSKERSFSETFRATYRPVLFERFDPRRNVLTGHTDNYISVEVPADNNSLINRVAQVRLGEPHKDRNEGYFSTGTLA